MEVLERELPVADGEMVSLAHVVERMAGQAYEDLTNLAETLPSLHPTDRKRKIVEWALTTRRHLIRLLVIVRWSSNAAGIQKCANIISFLRKQVASVDDAVDRMKEVAAFLPKTRMRNFDIPTAVDVLTSGSYQRLPTSIEKFYRRLPPPSDEAVLSTLAELDDVVHLRLASREILPPAMRNYRVADGRAYFHVPGLFEASFGTSGLEEKEQWWLLSFAFDIGVGGHGKEEFPRKPPVQWNEEINQCGNRELTPRLPPKYSAQADLGLGGNELKKSIEGGSEKPLPKKEKDAPFVRVFNFLQDCALFYQLEILAYQASHLAVFSWGNSLRAEHARDRRSLTIRYWVRPRTPDVPENLRFQQQKQEDPSPPSGTVTISMEEKKEAVDGVVNSHLSARWDMTGVVKGELGRTDLFIDPHDLNVEKLLLKVVRRHANAFLRSLESMLLSSPFFKRDMVSLQKNTGSALWSAQHSLLALHVFLHGTEGVSVSVNLRTGRLALRELPAEDADDASSTWHCRLGSSDVALQKATEEVNERPTKLAQILARLRWEIIVSEVEQQARYLGLPVQRGLPRLRPREYAKFGQSFQGGLFIRLDAFPDFYIVVALTELGFRFALVLVQTLIGEGAGALVIDQLSWVNKERIRLGATGRKRKRKQFAGPYSAAVPSFELKSEELEQLHAYCLGRVAVLKVEQQLKARGLPYCFPDFSSPAAQFSVTADQSPSQLGLVGSIPPICVQAKDLLGGSDDFVMNNILIKITDWRTGKRCGATIIAKLRVQASMFASQSAAFSRISYDPTRSLITFTSDTVENCIGDFLFEWSRIAKVVVLAREVARMSTSSDGVVQLDSFDLSTVAFRYGENAIAHVSWHPGAEASDGVYNLTFSSRRVEDEAASPGVKGGRPLKNPHTKLREAYLFALNTGDDTSSDFWRGFIENLRDTLPVLEEASSIADEDSLFEADTPELKLSSTAEFRLLYRDRYALDMRLVGGRFFFLDGTRSTSKKRGDDSNRPSGAGPPPSSSSPQSSLLASIVAPDLHSHPSHLTSHLSPIPDFCRLVSEAYVSVREDYTSSRVSSPCPNPSKAPSPAKSLPPVVDLGDGLLCSPAVARTLVRVLNKKICDKLPSVSSPLVENGIADDTAPNWEELLSSME